MSWRYGAGATLAVGAAFTILQLFVALSNQNHLISDPGRVLQQPEQLLTDKDATNRLLRGPSSTSGPISWTREGDEATNSSANSTKSTLLPNRYIFYHIYIPRDDEENAKMIIKEQLSQVGISSSKVGFNETYLYFNTVGEPLNDETYMAQICHDNNLQCYHLGHYTEGYEKNTLRDLQGFCSNQDDGHTQVIYMHSKGSYHSYHKNKAARRKQKLWRESMTEAVVSSDCQKGLKDNMCNVCALTFDTERFAFFPGNFFAAHCDYVGRLLDPFLFEEESNKLATDIRAWEGRGQLSFDLFPGVVGNDTLGMDRYSAEAWIGSHPTLRPCDTTKETIFFFSKRQKRYKNFFQVATAPRRPIQESLQIIYRHNKTTTTSNDSDSSIIPKSLRERKKQYFLTPGYLLRWFHFYGTVPSDDSWFWSHLPDDKYWKKAIREYGNRAVYEMTKGFIVTTPKQATTEAPKGVVKAKQMNETT